MAALLLGACGLDEGKPELPETFGAGVAGPAVDESAVVAVTLSDAGGVGMGSLRYDGSYFLDATALAGEEALLVLVGGSGVFTLAVSRIVGRPDTPCRFAAAVMARDDDYRILRSGERRNDADLAFHQVDLRREGTYRSTFCATLNDPAGILMLAEADSAGRISSQQTHYVINSVQGPP